MTSEPEPTVSPESILVQQCGFYEHTRDVRHVDRNTHVHLDAAQVTGCVECADSKTKRTKS